MKANPTPHACITYD